MDKMKLVGVVIFCLGAGMTDHPETFGMGLITIILGTAVVVLAKEPE